MEQGSKSPYVCTRCNKSFELESTHKRHGYYCRSRQSTGQRTSRKRSCTACTKAKTRCDLKYPSCSTCVAKHISCQYSEGSSSTLQGRDQDKEQSIESSSSMTTTSINTNPVSSDIFPSLIQAKSSAGLRDEQFLDSNATQLASEFLSYETQINSKEFAGLLDLEAVPSHFDWNLGGSNIEFTSAPSSPNDTNIQFSTMVHQSTDEPQQLSFLQNFPPSTTIPPSILTSHTNTSRSLTPRSFRKTGVQQTSALFLTRILSSYPAMMLRKETFPPFIHSIWYSESSSLPSNDEEKGGGESSLPEAIVNCMSIAQMFVKRTRESNKFLWRTVRMEQERLWSEYPRFDNWELLASVHALMIYTLMRMIEGPTDDNDFDIPLLLTLNAVSSTLSSRICENEMKEPPSREQQDWKEWIFHESRRRVVTIARILNMLIDIENAVTCVPLTGFTLFPLPAKKVLWEAPNAEVWRNEFSVVLRERELFGLSTEGLLMRMREEFGGMSTCVVDWGEWFAEMDSFGVLTMIASELL